MQQIEWNAIAIELMPPGSPKWSQKPGLGTPPPPPPPLLVSRMGRFHFKESFSLSISKFTWAQPLSHPVLDLAGVCAAAHLPPARY